MLIIILELSTLIIIGIIIFSDNSFRFLKIFTTSLMGTYSIIRGFGLIFGGFPDEEFISGLIKYKEIPQLRRLLLNESIAYTISLAVLLVLSVIIQFITIEEETNGRKDGNKGNYNDGKGRGKPSNRNYNDVDSNRMRT